MSDPRAAAAYAALADLVERFQNRVTATFGLTELDREATVERMLVNNSRRAPGYWLQLYLSCAIATLGLALGSSAVVIGAMLISPLMGPLVELGMGLAVGSALLVLRAFLRVAFSILGVIGGAALLTVLLPFHEVTAEIASRTSPTALDLLVAIFCAIAAAYTTVRPSSDTTAAAAGTAIGIALVPPLCVVGYGIGTGSTTVAGGALLLFTANFCAIVLFAVLAFLLVGYNQVDAEEFEREHVTNTERTQKLAARILAALERSFASSYGRAIRIGLPLMLVALVYVPLRSALAEVSWQVRVRDSIRTILRAEAPEAVQTSLVVERSQVAVRLLLVGTVEEAAAAERRLETRIAASSGVTPSVSVAAVPAAQALAAAAAAQREAPRTAVAAFDAPSLQRRAAEALARGWPEDAAGPLLGWTLDVPERGEPVVTLHHTGLPVGVVGERLLARELSTALAAPVRVLTVALPTSPVEPDGAGLLPWVARSVELMQVIPRLDRVSACVTEPAATGRRAAADSATRAILRETPAARLGRVEFEEGDSWRLRLARGSCSPAADSSGAGAAPADSAGAGGRAVS